ncbi:hypothetical protein V866_003072 [Kwoniella sp. B9012]
MYTYEYEPSIHDSTFFEYDSSYQHAMRDGFSFYPGTKCSWGERDDFAHMEAVRVGSRPVGWPTEDNYWW